jgi:transposase
MLYAGLDLSRKRLDFHLLDGEGATVEVGAAPPDADGLLGLTRRLDRHREPVRAAIESMNGARFVHDRLELQGWQVEIADAQKVKGLAPLACKTDRIDAWVLAELTRRDLVPAIWLPDPVVRAERERARWRLHLVHHRSSLKQRVHARGVQKLSQPPWSRGFVNSIVAGRVGCEVIRSISRDSFREPTRAAEYLTSAWSI